MVISLCTIIFLKKKEEEQGRQHGGHQVSFPISYLPHMLPPLIQIMELMENAWLLYFEQLNDLIEPVKN